MRLIDADKLKKHYAWWKGGTREMTMDEAKSDFDCIVDLQPTVEAEPIKHGRWIEDEYGIPHCSECKAINNTVYRTFCPNCGAKMDISTQKTVGKALEVLDEVEE